MPEWLNVLIRSVGAVMALFFLTRINGQRQISQLNIFEYIVGITAGSIAAFISADLDGRFFIGLLSMSVWLLFPVGLGWLALKSKILRDFVEGKGIVLIKNGKIMEDNLARVRYSTDELLEQLRTKNAFSVADVEFAVLEPSGSVNVLLKAEHQPLTAKRLGVAVAPIREPQTVIMDGHILDEPLATIGWTRPKLKEELEKLNVLAENVFLGQVDSKGMLTVDLYDDRIEVPAPEQDKLLLATLKKCAADLELFALSTENAPAREGFSSAARKVDAVLSAVTPLLHR